MLSVGFKTLLHREVYRFLRLFWQTIVPPIVRTLLYILIFGFSLGSHIGEIHGTDYVAFILPALAMMGLIQGAFSNSAFSLFQAKMERSIENLLTAPLNYFQIVVALLFGGLVRGLTTAVCAVAVAACFVRFPFEHAGFIVLAWLVTGVLFASLGLLVGVWAKSWNQMEILQTFVLTPLIYLGGSFYSLKMLPPLWQNISLFNPILYSIDLTRYGFLGVSDISHVKSLAVLTALALAAFFTAVWSFRRGIDIQLQ